MSASNNKENSRRQGASARQALKSLRRRARHIPGRKRLFSATTRSLGRLASTPIVGTSADRLLVGISGILDQPVPVAEVLRIVATLEARAVPFWLAGGWGIDALVGFSSREHGDVDLVLDDFEGSLGATIDALASINYRCVSQDRAALWLPDRASFEDSRGHSIEVLGIDWDLLDAAGALLEAEPGPSDTDPASHNTISNPEWKKRVFTVGQLGGRAVPCLSRKAQVLFHGGYEQRPQDTADLRQLRWTDQTRFEEDLKGMSGLTTLLIPLVGLSPDELRVWSQFNGREGGMPPHLTILYPFLPAAEIDEAIVNRLRKVCALHPAFDFTFGDVGWFDERVLFLQPDLSERFVELTRALMAEFPQCLPYGGQFADINPHLTLSDSAPVEQLRRAAVRVSRQLPMAASASELWLMADEGERWCVVRSIPLGS